METECLSSDRISTLPRNIIENILTLMPIRDALRTSILSRSWRSYWKNMPKLAFDYNSVVVPSNCEKLTRYKFVNAIFHVLLLHTSPILEFSLKAGKLEMDSEFHQIICHLSRNNNLKKLVFEMSNFNHVLSFMFFSFQGLEVLELTICYFKPPSTFNGFRKLKSLSFVNVKVNFKTFQHFLSNCPLLTDVLLGGRKKSFEQESKFTFVELLQCLPLLRTLDISVYHMRYLSAGGMPHTLPTSAVHLKYLFLDVNLMQQDQIRSALSLMRNSPKLEKIILRMYASPPVPYCSLNFPDFQYYSSFNLDHLKEFQMLYFSNEALELEILKLIIVKAPMLKKVRLELFKDVSVEEELKILRDFIPLPFPLASPSTKFSIERPKPSS